MLCRDPDKSHKMCIGGCNERCQRTGKIMNNCNWTAGPWSINTDRNGTWIDSESESFPVCMIDGDSDRLSDQDKTNANLISAAPELYSALDELMDAYMSILNSAYCQCDEDYDTTDKAKSALAKARGETE